MEKVTVQTKIASNLNHVWECWTQPEHITQWNFASPDWCCPKAENNLQPDGKFSWRMEAKDGSMGFDFEGTYTTIEDKKQISYEIADGRKVTIQFLPLQNTVTVSETFETESMNPVELQRKGWQAILDNFKHYVESK